MGWTWYPADLTKPIRRRTARPVALATPLIDDCDRRVLIASILLTSSPAAGLNCLGGDTTSASPLEKTRPAEG
jgi:hypothetical protein